MTTASATVEQIADRFSVQINTTSATHVVLCVSDLAPPASTFDRTTAEIDRLIAETMPSLEALDNMAAESSREWFDDKSWIVRD